MVRMIQDVVLLLNRLIHLDYDAIDACKAAIAHMDDPRDRHHLNTALEDHRAHADQLAVVVRNLGGEPACPGDLRPSRRRLAAALSEHSLLETLRRSEESNRAAYAAAASQPGVPLDVLATLERNLADECRHLAWVSGRLDGPSSSGSRGTAWTPAAK
jgi:uncharacterized protein (TIGR02284 family)